MAHFAILAQEAAGHLLSIGTLGGELQRRGHQVSLIGLAKSLPLAERLGLTLQELPEVEVPKRQTPVLRSAAAQLFRLKWAVGLQTRFLWKSELILRTAPAILRELQVDGLIVDETIVSGGTLAEHLKLPYVTVCPALHWFRDDQTPPHITGWRWATGHWARLRNRLGYAAWETFMRPPLRLLNGFRQQWKLPFLKTTRDLASPHAYISQLCAELDFPHGQLPANFHYVGSLASDRASDRDDTFPWDRLDGRPLIYASLGTVRSTNNLGVYRKIARACHELDAQLVVALGSWKNGGHTTDELGRLDGDPLVVGFAPQTALLEKAAAIVTHAGMNTVLESLIRGVPMVALPRSADQPAMAARSSHAGAGLALSFRRSTPEQLRQAIERVLVDSTFRNRSKQLGEALRAAGGARRAADIVERALVKDRPALSRA